MATVAESRIAMGRSNSSVMFDRLFMEEYPKVVAIANRVLADSHEAEDVAQEVFCQYHRSYPPDAPFAAAWLHAAAAHSALNVIRGKRRRLLRETLEATSRVRLTEDAEQALNPEQALEVLERRQEVRALLAKLPQRSAAVLALRYGGLSYAEIASALRIKPDQVGTLLRRAEAALRKEYGHGSCI